MTEKLIHTIENEGKGQREFTISLKLFISFLILILNIETISYVLLRNDIVITLFQKALSSLVLIFSFLMFFTWRKADRFCFLLFIVLLGKMVMESLIGYGSVLIYPSVLAVIFPFLYVYFIKNLYRRLNMDILNILIASIFIGYFSFMVLFGREFDFSNSPLMNEESGPYSGDTRILHANSILLIVLPFLYYLNQLLSERKTYFAIGGFSISLIIILIHQHRTVWLVAIFSTLILFLLKGTDKKMLRKLLYFLLIIAVVFTLMIFAIPGLNELLIERFVDVLDPLNEDNTGGFRYLQILAYINYFIQKPLFGWSFSGFELSNPFLTDAWEEDSGHHFHNAYIEVLFYFGITGFLFKFYPLYTVAKKISKKLSDRSKVLAAFSISGFLYAFSYVPPLIFWGIVGLCLYNIERDINYNNYHQVKHNNE